MKLVKYFILYLLLVLSLMLSLKVYFYKLYQVYRVMPLTHCHLPQIVKQLEILLEIFQTALEVGSYIRHL